MVRLKRDASRPSEPFPWRACLLVFVVAAAVRAFFMTLLPGDALRPSLQWELDSIAQSLVLEGVYGNPYVVPSGPTAHLPPIPPFLLAGIYQVFGITVLAGGVAWGLRLLFQALLLGLLPWIGLRVGLGWQAGLIGGLAGALWPQYAAHGESEASLLIGLLVVAAAVRWQGIAGGARRATEPGPGPEPAPSREPSREPSLPRPVSSLLLGAGFGVAFHAQPAFLPVLFGYLAFELWMRADRRRWRSAALVLLGAFVACVPWGIRNVRSLDAVIFVRSNFGLEMHIGNHEGAQANIDHRHYRDYRTPREWSHPRLDVDDALEIRDGGEIAYMRRKGRQAAEWIRAHPGEFVRLTVGRFRHFWLGPLLDPVMSLAFLALAGFAAFGLVGAVRRLPGDRLALLVIPLLLYPPVYYLVPWQHRYRFPIEWILFLLAGAAVWWLLGPRRLTSAPSPPFFGDRSDP